MLFNPDTLHKQRICVNCETEKETELFVNECIAQGYKFDWSTTDAFAQYHEQTTFRITPSKALAFARSSYYKDLKYEVITLSALIGMNPLDLEEDTTPEMETYLDASHIYDKNTVIEIDNIADLQLLYSEIKSPVCVSESIIQKYIDDGRPFCINLSRDDALISYALTTTYKRNGKIILKLTELVKQREVFKISSKYPTMQELLGYYKLKAEDVYRVKLALNYGAMHETIETIVINEIKEDLSNLRFTLLGLETMDTYWYSEMSVFQIIKKLN